jgi:thymidine phosphorylase
MKSEGDASELARALVDLGVRAGVRTEALITSMRAPLGRAVGNAVEIVECVDVLRGRGPDDVTELLVAIGARMVALSGRHDRAGAERAVRSALASGAGLDKLRAMVGRQGGDVSALDDARRLPSAARREAIAADRSGYVSGLDAGLVGRSSMLLGAGRQRVEDRIDHGAGVLIAKRPGEPVAAGDPVLELLYNDDRGLPQAMACAREAIVIADEPPALEPLILGVVR